MKSCQWPYRILLMLMGVLASCDTDEPRSPSGCTLHTISLTPPGTIYTAHRNTEGRITEVSNFSEDGWIGTTYAYDAKGRLTYASNWTFTYDDKDRLIRIGRPASEFTQDFSYNAHGQLTNVFCKQFGMGEDTIRWNYAYTYPVSTTQNHSMITTNYGATETFEYDNKPNPFKSNWKQLSAAYLLQFDLLLYHTDNNITRITHIEGTTTIVSNFIYQHNEWGYPIQIDVSMEVSTPEGSWVLIPPVCKLSYTCE